MTATARRPAQSTGTSTGGLACGELESGTTTTVRRRSLRILLVSTTQGRVLRISEPNVGSSRTHQISPRRGIIPRLPDIVGQQVKLLLKRCQIWILIGNLTGNDQL